MLTLLRLPREKILLLGLLLGLVVLGGASRADAMSQAFVRALALCAIVAVFWRQPGALRIDCSPLVWLLAGWTSLMALQLVPLPPALWSGLPGREILIRFYDVVGRPLPWWPISMVPYVTVNSLFAMIVPWAALLVAAKLRDDNVALEILVLGFLILSMAIGALQMASGGHAFYFYRITNLGSPVGLFSNRNHNAFMAVMIMPLLASTLARKASRERGRMPYLAVLGLVSFVVLIDVLVIGSRMGLLLFGVAAVASWALFRSGERSRAGHRARPAKTPALNTTSRKVALGGILTAAAGVALTVLILFQDRFTAFWRFGGHNEEGRLTYIRPVLNLAEKYFPFGSGFGTFSTVFKIDEPDRMLQLSYLNHAHNDVLEIMVEGGIFAIALALAFVVLWIRRSVAVWKIEKGSAGDEWRLRARLGSVLSGLLLLASATDYPLRTPACTAVFAIACYWLFVKREASVD